MGSIDIPPFLRDKMKGKIQSSQPDTGAEIPPFLKKKESTQQDPVSPDGTGSGSLSKSQLNSTFEPVAPKEQRHEEIANADAVSLLDNYKAKSTELKAKADTSPFIQDKINYNTFQQSREGKTAQTLDNILNKGNFNTSDINYLKKAAPKAAKQIIKTFVPDAKDGEELSDENVNKMVNNGTKALNDLIIQQKVQGNQQKDAEIKGKLTSFGIDPAKFSDPLYVDKVSADVQAKRQVELSTLEAKYPLHFYSGSGGAAAPVRDNPQAYEKEKSAIEQKYSDINNSIGLSKAYDYAKLNPSVDSKQIGEQWYKYADPDGYKLWAKAGKKGPIDRDIAFTGVNALYGSGKQGAAQLAKKDEDVIDDQYPDQIIAETYHRIGAELYKDENWFLNRPRSIAQMDEAAQQLPQKYRDVYYKHIRDKEKNSIGTDVPMSGLVNKIGEGFASTAVETGKFVGDVTGLRSEKDQAIDAVNQSTDTKYQDVGTYAPAVQRLDQLKKKEKLTPDEIHEKQDLESFTGVRSRAQEVVDGTGNLTGQVLFQAVGTKGLGRVLGAGAKAAGLLKTEAAVAGLTAEESIYADAVNIGINKPMLTAISADAIAFGSSYDAAKIDALRLMPDDKDSGKRLAYANIVAGLNAATERIFKDEKVLNAFNKEISPSIKSVVEKLGQGEITKEALAPAIVKALKESASFVGHATIENTKESVEEVASSIGQSIATAILAPSKFNLTDAFNDATSTFTSMFANGGLVAAMAGVNSHRASHAGIPAFSKFGVDPEFTDNVKSFINAQLKNGNFTPEEANTKFGIVAAMSNINKIVMPQVNAVSNLSEKAKGKYGMQLLNEHVLQTQVDHTTDEVLKGALEQKIKDSQGLRKSIIGKELFVDDNYRIKTEKELQENPPKGLVAPEGFEYAEDGSLRQKGVKSNDEIEAEVRKTVPESVVRMVSKEIQQLHEDDKFPPAVSSLERQNAVKNPLAFLKSIAEQANTIDNIVGDNLSAANGAVAYYGQDLVDMAKEVFPNHGPMGNIIKDVADKGNEVVKRTMEAFAAEGKPEEAMDHLKERALDSPNDLKKDLGMHKNLTIDIIAQNTPTEINDAILKFEDEKSKEEEKKGETRDAGKIADIDKHISLLQKGLEKSQNKLSSVEETKVENISSSDLIESLDKADQSKVSVKQKNAATEAVADKYGEKGKKALLIHRNFDDMVKSLKEQNKIDIKC